MHLLIADDDPTSRRILEKKLTELGYQISVAGDGLEAWELLQQNDIRIVISDWVMPKMDGLSLCHRIREDNRKGYIYLIFLTSKGLKEDLLEGLEAGADDYLTKPFDLAELKLRLKTAERIVTLENKLLKQNHALSILNLRLKELARIDALMQIGNRRSFNEAIVKIHDLAQRYHRGYGIVMCDMDNFKAYNDLYGHQAGDQLLKKVAENLRKTVRKSDEIFRVGEENNPVSELLFLNVDLPNEKIFIHDFPNHYLPQNAEVFRFGGEEIVFLLPEQDSQGAARAAERIRVSIEDQKWEHKGNAAGIVTISCGVACCDEKNPHLGWKEILENADRALYLAKKAGRNCVRILE